MRRARKPTAKALVRLALHYAIEEREGWLSSVGDPPHQDDVRYVERAKALIAQWQDLLAKRYGERPMSHRVPGGDSVSLLEVVNAPPQDFNASMKPLRLSDDETT